MPLAVIGAIVGEFVGSEHGLGHLILEANANARTDLLFAALIAVSIVAGALYLARRARRAARLVAGLLSIPRRFPSRRTSWQSCDTSPSPFPTPQKAAEFYSETFDLEIVEPTESPIASGVYLSDGTICLALLNYKTDAAAGLERGKNWVGTHHFGFWVDDLEAQRAAIESAWRQVLHGPAARQEDPVLRDEVPRSQRCRLRHLAGRMGRREK